ncbi:phosphatase PAP2 family protein [Terrihabitans rhizophilus]|uniref:Phosphatase PAP2 family protein n=1 Tax=Terrihabitans rhizophilus TaxID=3092662 RepID=A0ABU4RMD0_9HYPH|nr:phosphatase PAP2 family protein [Terrihabitans sp. PJ23]MDX6805736.1 phosphatase PAP2 family protein [Terrihabitans sp. PJ23]
MSGAATVQGTTFRTEQTRHPATPIFLAAGAILVVDLVWLAASGIALEVQGFGVAALVIAALAAAGAFWTRVKPEPVLAGMALSTAGLGAFTIAIAVLHYLAAALGRPLFDDQLSAWESGLGFDWPAYIAWIEQHETLAHLLAQAYHTSGPQVGLVVVALSAAREFDRLWAYVRMFCITLAVAIGVSALFPAEGPYAHYGVAAGLDRLETVGAVWHLQPLEALRNGTLQTLALTDIRGLVTFPSFHVCLALLTVWALWRIPALNLVALLVNAAIVVATLSAGGHYLPDLLAGGAVAAFAIAGLRVHAVSLDSSPKSRRIRSDVIRAPS